MDDTHTDHALEQSVLDAILARPDQIPSVTRLLAPGDFYWSAHTHIYQAILADQAENPGHVDHFTVLHRLTANGNTPGSGTWHEIVAGILGKAPVASNAERYAEQLVTLARRRKVASIAAELAADPKNPHHLKALRAVETTPGKSRLVLEPWAEFVERAAEHIPTLVRDLWPDAAFGFIAGPPKSRKTWLGMALAIAVATGKPLFGRYAIPNPRPVVYVALEGSRAAIKQRIGCITRGYGLDPDHDLANLRFVYKPAGINLADQAWAAELVALAAGCGLVVVDVLRAATQSDENSNTEFAALARNLAPFADQATSVALLHHFGKFTESTGNRATGERMAGAGAMYGAADVAIYMAGKARNPSSRIEIVCRDLAEPDPFGFTLEGSGSGPNGGYLYTDACRLELSDPEAVDDQDEHVDPLLVVTWLRANGAITPETAVAPKDIRDELDITSNRAWKALLDQLLRYGVKGNGKGTRALRYWIEDPA